jgi:hypothetical protein
MPPVSNSTTVQETTAEVGLFLRRFFPGKRSDLKPGAKIFVAAAAKQPDGTFLAPGIRVGKVTLRHRCRRRSARHQLNALGNFTIADVALGGPFLVDTSECGALARCHGGTACVLSAHSCTAALKWIP